MCATTKELPVSLRVEIAFAVTKFSQLPEKERTRILRKLKSDNKARRTQAAKELGDLLCKSDEVELTRFVNDKLAGGQNLFDVYVPFLDAADYNNKCLMVGMYFYDHLPKKAPVFRCREFNSSCLHEHRLFLWGGFLLSTAANQTQRILRQ